MLTGDGRVGSPVELGDRLYPDLVSPLPTELLYGGWAILQRFHAGFSGSK